MKKETNNKVLPFPRAIQGAARRNDDPERNQEYIKAGDIVRKHANFVKQAFEMIRNTPPHLIENVTISLKLNLDCSLSDLAMCLDDENIIIRYPFFQKSKDRETKGES